jgi:hypothetical protein
MGDSVTTLHTLSAPDPRALALHTLAIDFAAAYERRLPSQRAQVLDVVSETDRGGGPSARHARVD